jgi:2-polyprenyl-3-methyl-5-hydroxy-6-metoxy-1,4-benzoquinol methylase
MVLQSNFVLFFFVSLICLCLSKDEKQWMMHSENTWDKEWKTGKWSYLEDVPAERARVAVIGALMVQRFAPGNGSVLDIGCGEGAIADFLTPTQKAMYVGVDLSKEAIHIAKKKRGHPMRFVHAAAHRFEPQHKFDAVVFSDVLYYTEYEKILKQYNEYLNPGGVVIISIFHFKEALLYEEIFKCARTVFDYVDELEISGYTQKEKGAKREKVFFHLEVLRKKSM